MAFPEPSGQTGAQASARLQAMGIPPGVLGGAIDDAWRSWWSRSTENDVLGMSGYLAWGKVLRFLRDKLLPLGWSIGRDQGFETVVSPDRSFQIACAPGNSNTGDPRRMPATRNDKGPRTKLVVAANNQLSFDDLHTGRPSDPEQPAIETWFLLFYHDAKREEIRIELSRGMTFTANNKTTGHGVISHFRPRICLEAIGTANVVIEEPQPEQSMEEQYDIPVVRRAS